MGEEIKIQLDSIIGVLNAVDCYESERQLKEIEEKIINIITNLQQKVEQLEKENKELKYLVDDSNIMKAFIVEHNKTEQLENIRKEAIEYVRKHPCNTWYYTKERDNKQTFGNREVIRCDTELLNILNKGSDKE